MITGLEEKRWGTRRLGSDSEQFHRTISMLDLIDVEMNNIIFTWSNRRSGEQYVSYRLDRFLISEPFILEGLTWQATVIDTPGSDHWSILLTINISGTPGKKPFRFEKFGLTHPDFQENISLLVEGSDNHKRYSYVQFQQKLKNLKQRLKTWNKSTFGNIFQAQEILNQQIQDLQQQIRHQGFTDSLKDQESTLNKQLAERRAQE
jgi:hypothetical protein